MLNSESEPMLTAIAMTIDGLIGLILYYWYGGSRKSAWIARRGPKWRAPAVTALLFTAWTYGLRLDS
jgi:hypothetical protein